MGQKADEILNSARQDVKKQDAENADQDKKDTHPKTQSKSKSPQDQSAAVRLEKIEQIIKKEEGQGEVGESKKYQNDSSAQEKIEKVKNILETAGEEENAG